MRRGRIVAVGAVLIATVAALGLALTGCTVPGDDEATGGIPDAALAVMAQPEYKNGQWSLYAEDLETGEVLVDLNSDVMLAPGSFVKTYSSGAAWLQFGPDSTIITPVKRTGELVDGVLQGDLVLVGQGDLTMGGRTKADGSVDFTNLDHNDANPLPGATLTTEDPLAGLDDLAAQVKAAGIDAVSGNVVIDDRLFSGRLVGEVISPIVINQNVVDVLVTPGAVGESATVELIPAVAPWTIAVDIETVAAGEEFKIEDPVSKVDGEISISGTIAADADPQLKVVVFTDPATFARTAFIEALQRAGVSVSADPIAANSTAALPDQAAVEAMPSVAELESLPLAEEVTYVMKVSYNRGAQTLICRLAVSAGSSKCDDGIPVAGEIWRAAGLDTTDTVIIDGSGLDGNYITARNAVNAQRIMAEGPDAERWRATMPILGVDGSLATVQSDSPSAGKVFAKTGTLLGGDFFNGDLRFRLATKTLGGVMETETGRTVLFTIMVNNGVVPTIEDVFIANNDVGAVAAAIQQAF
jgi:D-alanyl-D-alanine carboxypeptidase/D-alanyl-D-alanine-endopeptidase (penicillin-binding protein 4)